MWPRVITFLLVFLNGYFVAAEFALVKLRDSQLQLLIKQWSPKAKLLGHMKEHLDAYLSASQLGITLASLALGWVGESLAEQSLLNTIAFFNLPISGDVVHYISVPLAFLLITTFHIVLGEQAPKSFAIRFPLDTAMLIAHPLRRFYIIFKPFIRLLNTLSLKTLHLFGLHTSNDDHDEEVHSEEELRLLISESEEGGEINQSERELIHNVFDFDDKEVSQVMTHTQDIIAIDIRDTTDDIVQKVVEEWYSRVPVYNKSINDMTWRILVKDILLALARQQKILLNNFIRPLHFVAETQKISDVLKLFQKFHIQLAVVTSEYGTTVGLVTLEDILEQLVGDIEDESDDTNSPVQQISATEFVVHGKTSISDVNEYLPFVIPEDERYTTISGLMNSVFGRIPSVKEVWHGEGYDLIVLKRRKQMVEEVKIVIRAV